jgi:hypothetical protein
VEKTAMVTHEKRVTKSKMSDRFFGFTEVGKKQGVTGGDKFGTDGDKTPLHDTRMDIPMSK